VRIGTILLGLTALGLLGVGCAPPHYSVSVARGPAHITYAQRHHNLYTNDYLVDCEIDEAGNRSNCEIIELKPAGH